MKNNAIIILMVLSLASCKQTTRPAQTPVTIGSVVYQGYGATLDAQSVMSMDNLAAAYASMTPSDTVYTKVEGKIKEVCSKKGCWMTLDMGSGNDIMVRFKDYGFFMPLDAEGAVIVSGKAFVSETSVDDLKHYAEDAGATEAAIEAIVSPEKTYSFEAVGALLAI
tara:strand:- start:2420 stop:2917 length:498 start_codon:yes stop_codon:yes gene_type:complete